MNGDIGGCGARGAAVTVINAALGISFRLAAPIFLRPLRNRAALSGSVNKRPLAVSLEKVMQIEGRDPLWLAARLECELAAKKEGTKENGPP